MNKSENGHGKSRGRESRVCTWEKITKIRAADGEDSDGDRARSRRWRVWQSLVFCLWSCNVHLSPHSVLQTFCTYAVGKEEEEMWCENFEEELKRKRGKWDVGKRETLLCENIWGRATVKLSLQFDAKIYCQWVPRSLKFWKPPKLEINLPAVSSKLVHTNFKRVLKEIFQTSYIFLYWKWILKI